jgi:uncharacterized protein
MHSAIYEGSVRHRRYRPVINEFRYPLFMLYADLRELDEAFVAPGWSTHDFNLAWFRRGDYMKSQAATDLSCAVRDMVETQCGQRPAGPIRMLTHFRYFGFGMNPVSFYYCFDALDQRLEYILAEINNTPWGEQFTYVLPRSSSAQDGRWLAFEFSKDFHVSPFMPMNLRYRWRFSPPDSRAAVHMENIDDEGVLFDATLILKRTQISPARLQSLLLRYPFMTAQIVARIYAQAARLWWKKTPAFAHPKHSRKEHSGNVNPTPVRLVSRPSANTGQQTRAALVARRAGFAPGGTEARFPHAP